MRLAALSVLVALALGRSPVAHAQSPTARPDTAVGTLRRYIEMRLDWADWKEYSQFITWPDEPSWDCYWVAKQHSIGQATERGGKVLIPVTYSRLGLSCDLDFTTEPKTDGVQYELVRERGVWKVDSPVPDYPYIDWQILRKSLAKSAADKHESPKQRKQARSAIDALVTAATLPSGDGHP